MKTPDSFWTDPSADELVLRHKIYSGTPLSPSLSVGRPQLFVSHISEAITGTPQLAREHVESLHQNAHSSLIFGKNNVVLNMVRRTVFFKSCVDFFKSCVDFSDSPNTRYTFVRSVT